jgi:pectate lyase
VYIDGQIDAWTDVDGNALTCTDFNRDGYTLEGYLATYDPEHWDGPASGEMEDARRASYLEFRNHILLRPGSNTTIVGTDGASVTHASFLLSNVDNVIIRNLGLHDAYDCFPRWRGSDWDAQFDNIEVSGSTHIWLDHLTIDNGDTADYEQPHYFGKLYDVHDGAIDIVRGSDLVTVSWNHIRDHDKTMLIGNTDSASWDEWDRLRVTLHHTWFENAGQRTPRLRYGQNHVYNNYYTYDAASSYPYYYSMGAGVHSSIYAENNAFDMPDIDPGDVLRNWGGDGIHVEGSVFNGRWTDLLAAHNASHPDQAMTGEVDRLPEYHGTIHPTRLVPILVQSHAGADGL